MVKNWKWETQTQTLSKPNSFAAQNDLIDCCFENKLTKGTDIKERIFKTTDAKN
jgi:hypothetical protein